MERVGIIQGEVPILIVVPHGGDNWGIMRLGEVLAHDLGAYAVINKGWRQSRNVDSYSDLADCNDIRHLYEDVVRDEFLNPLLRAIARMKKKFSERILVFILRDCDGDTRGDPNDELLDIVVGYGLGNPPAHSCKLRTKNILVHNLQGEGFGVYEAGPGNKYAGKAKKNLNQFFVRWQPEEKVETMQMAFATDLVCDNPMIEMTAEGILSAIESLRLTKDDEDVPSPEVKRI